MSGLKVELLLLLSPVDKLERGVYHELIELFMEKRKWWLVF